MLTVSELLYSYRANNRTETLSFDFSLDAGSVTAILGPSGAGKSTLLALLCGLLAPESGSIVLDGGNITGQPAHQRPLSILFQEHNLFAHLSVADNIALGLSPSLSLSRDQHAQVEEAASAVGLSGYLERLPGTLSGGQKQRVALARCLVRKRPLLLLDEPFSALDPALRKEMLALVNRVAKETATTILMVTHHPEDARLIADNVLFVSKGKVVCNGPVSLIDSPPDGLRHYFDKQ